MKGISIIIPGADFSGSPLGTVTFVKSAEERAADIVSAYATAVGDSTHNEELITMVIELINLGVWNNIDVYPMFGSTLSNKLVNLNPDGFTGNNLVVGANASNGTDCIEFSNTVDIGAYSGNSKNSSTFTNGFFSFIDFNFVRNGMNGSTIFDYKRSVAPQYLGLVCGTAFNGSIIASELKFKTDIPDTKLSGGINLYDNATTTSTRTKTLFALYGSDLKIIDESGTYNKSLEMEITEYNVIDMIGGVPTTGAGGSTIEPTKTLFNGKIHMIARGDVPANKLAYVREVLSIKR